jgi:hypothetical protein
LSSFKKMFYSEKEEEEILNASFLRQFVGSRRKK